MAPFLFLALAVVIAAVLVGNPLVVLYLLGGTMVGGAIQVRRRL